MVVVITLTSTHCRPLRYAGIVHYGIGPKSLNSTVNGSAHNLVYEMTYTVKKT